MEAFTNAAETPYGQLSLGKYHMDNSILLKSKNRETRTRVGMPTRTTQGTPKAAHSKLISFEQPDSTQDTRSSSVEAQRTKIEIQASQKKLNKTLVIKERRTSNSKEAKSLYVTARNLNRDNYALEENSLLELEILNMHKSTKNALDLHKNKKAITELLFSAKDAHNLKQPRVFGLVKRKDENIPAEEVQHHERQNRDANSFLREKLKLLEDRKKKISTERGTVEFYFNLFQEVIEHETQSMMSRLLQAIKNGLYEHLGQFSIRRAEIENLKKRLVTLESHLREEKDYSKELAQKYKMAEDIIKEYKEQTPQLLKQASFSQQKGTCLDNFEQKVEKFGEKLNEMHKKLSEHKSKNNKTQSLLNVMSFNRNYFDLKEHPVKEYKLHKVRPNALEDSHLLDTSAINSEVNKSSISIVLEVLKEGANQKLDIFNGYLKQDLNNSEIFSPEDEMSMLLANTPSRPKRKARSSTGAGKIRQARIDLSESVNYYKDGGLNEPTKRINQSATKVTSRRLESPMSALCSIRMFGDERSVL